MHPLASSCSFENALRHQPKSFPDHESVKPIAAAIFVVGQILVLSSTWALGVTGTYLGDYCGILQDKMGTLKDHAHDAVIQLGQLLISDFVRCLQ